ncbi:MAG: hypothetical protein SOW00_04545 [Oscillospiraceae bacterium]|nr:hypothetical protein [Oscillospiraceae bacterium]
MDNEQEKKGITVKIDADLHAEVRQYLEATNMTMAEFVTQALDDELHPKFQKEDMKMENTRTIAFQVPEDLFQRLKDYLRRNEITQRQLLITLIEDELEREQTEREAQETAPEQTVDALEEAENDELVEDEQVEAEEVFGLTM